MSGAEERAQATIDKIAKAHAKVEKVVAKAERQPAKKAVKNTVKKAAGDE